MIDSKIVELRVHTEVLGRTGQKRKRKTSPERNLPKWPRCALVLDCETTVDERQSLTFGCFHYCRPKEMITTRRWKDFSMQTISIPKV